jgi:hypothetical protein
MATKLSPQLVKQSQEAPFIFLGRVQAVGKNNLQGIATTPDHALVQVEEVLIAPTNLGDLRGRVLTVVLAKPAKKNTRAVWWATSWVFDREIGVVETGRAEAAKVMAAATEVIEARLTALDAGVIERVASADLVVAGTVVGIEDLGVDGIAEGTTWLRALVRVSRVVKGESDAEVVIQFPGAGSPRWAYVPRLVLGQQGVWILHRPSREPRMRKVKVSGAWVALDPDDVHTLSSLPRIEAFARVAHLRGRRTARAR